MLKTSFWASVVSFLCFWPWNEQWKSTKSSWLTFSARVSVPFRTGRNRECPFCEAVARVSVLAFGRQADALAKHHKGELVSVAGNMQVSQWTGQNGETRRGWQVIADSVISARTARPGGKKGQQGQATDALNRAKQQSGNDDPYGDNIPF